MNLSGKPFPLIPPTLRRSASFLPGNLRFVFLLIPLFLALFSLLRFLLIHQTYNPSLATRAELTRSYLVGLRFDLATTSFLLIPIIAFCYIPFTAPWHGQRTRSIFLWLLTALIAALTFIALAECEFFREFQARYNELALRYLTHAQTVGGMVWYDYPVFRYLALCLAITAVAHLALRAIFRLSFGARPTAPAPQTRYAITREIASAVIITITLIFSARGGFQGEPLRWGEAFEGPNEYANQMSLNGLYSLGSAAHEMATRNQASSGWKDQLPLPEARSLARSLILSPSEALLDPEKHTTLRSGLVPSSLHLTRPDGLPVNVVVVMMESFSARYSGSTGATRSFTPHFDALAKDGVFFDRILSAGSHTHQGIFATQLGFPNLPGYETLMDSAAGNQMFLSLSRIFEDRGYQTYFLYNGDLEWDNMNGFFQKQGVNHFISGADMLPTAKYPDPVWGVSDTDLFTRANQEFEAASKKGPFMAAVMTLSNHSPYIIPPVPGTPGPAPDLEGRHQQRMQAMQYADFALGQFIDEAKKLSYFKNTLFVFVGDHGTNVLPMYTEIHLLYHHVPLLFYAPGLTDQKRVDHRTGSQLDILPSILSALDLHDTPHADWGRSLFDDSFHDGGFAIFKQTGGGRAVAMAQDNRLLVLNSSAGHPLFMTYDLGPNPSIKPLLDPTLQTHMERQLRAYIQAGLHDLNSHNAGPLPTNSPPSTNLTILDRSFQK